MKLTAGPCVLKLSHVSGAEGNMDQIHFEPVPKTEVAISAR